MKILVGCKRVIDYAVKIKVRKDNLGVVTENVKHSMNPFDEIAIEEALLLKEKGIANQIIAVTIGPEKSLEVLKSALALGADKGIFIKFDDISTTSPLNIAKIFHKIIKRENADLVIFGKQAIDDDYGQCGPMVAGLLDWPQATFASKVNITDTKTATIQREIDNGLETIKATLPMVITTDLRLNEPRYATLSNIMKAKSKPIETLNASELHEIKNTLIVESVKEPGVRKKGIRVESVNELVEKLKQAKLLPSK